FVTGFVPALALFAAAPGVSKGEHHPSVCHGIANAEVGIGTHPVSAIASEDAATRSVKRDSLFVNDGERNHGAVVPGYFDFFGDQLFESRIGEVAVEDTFCESVLAGVEIINRHRVGPVVDVHDAAIAPKIR